MELLLSQLGERAVKSVGAKKSAKRTIINSDIDNNYLCNIMNIDRKKRFDLYVLSIVMLLQWKSRKNKKKGAKMYESKKTICFGQIDVHGNLFPAARCSLLVFLSCSAALLRASR